MLEHSSQYHPQTAAIRCGHRRTAEREHNEPIFTTSSFVFDSAAQAAALFKGDEQGNVYSRFTNPTVSGFENRLAAMEGGRFGLATASGMAAISGLLLGLLKAGDHVVASAELFGSTVSVFSKVFNRFGIETTFVRLTDVDQWQAAIRPNTRLLFLESPSNPLCEIADVKAIAAIAESAGVLLAVDNAFCTPVMQRPLELGADIVVHTATKYLDGQGRCVGDGSICLSTWVLSVCWCLSDNIYVSHNNIALNLYCQLQLILIRKMSNNTTFLLQMTPNEWSITLCGMSLC